MDTNLVELAERSNDGIAVRLLWSRETGEVVLEVIDDRTGAGFELEVPGERALDAFRHPFVYVSSPGGRVVAPDVAGATGAAAGFRRTA